MAEVTEPGGPKPVLCAGLWGRPLFEVVSDDENTAGPEATIGSIDEPSKAGALRGPVGRARGPGAPRTPRGAAACRTEHALLRAQAVCARFCTGRSSLHHGPPKRVTPAQWARAGGGGRTDAGPPDGGSPGINGPDTRQAPPYWCSPPHRCRTGPSYCCWCACESQNKARGRPRRPADGRALQCRCRQARARLFRLGGGGAGGAGGGGGSKRLEGIIL